MVRYHDSLLLPFPFLLLSQHCLLRLKVILSVDFIDWSVFFRRSGEILFRLHTKQIEEK